MAQRPNIVLLCGEDTGRHHGCYGDPYAHTPHIDRLAGEGCLYDKAYTTSPVCSPSRTALVTGRLPWTMGTHHHRSQRLLQPRMFTHELRDSGYRVLWPTKTDFNLDVPDGYAGEMTPWLQSGELPDEPFFAYWNFFDTHESGMWDAHYDERVRELEASQKHDPAQAPVPPYLVDTPEVRRDIARYYDLVTLQDQGIGKVLDLLERKGLAENTVVIYLSDHGRGLPREKRWCYEAGVHLPLVVRWPGHLQAGVVSQRLVSWVDIAPTILSIAGVDVPSEYEGQSFLGTDEREHVFMGRDRMDNTFDLVRGVRDAEYLYLRNGFPQLPYMQEIAYMENEPAVLALREGRAASTLNPTQAAWMADTKPAEELYRPAEDPHCVQNLAEAHEHQAALVRLRAALDAQQSAQEDLGQTCETELVARGLIRFAEFGGSNSQIPERFKIGRGDSVATITQAIERYGRPSD